MSVLVSLMSRTNGELKRFLDSYFNEDTQIDDDVSEWIYIYNNPMDAVKIINKFFNNSIEYEISLWIGLNDDDVAMVNMENKEYYIETIHNLASEKLV